MLGLILGAGETFNKFWLLFLFDSNVWNIGPLKSSDFFSRAAVEKRQKAMFKYSKKKKLGKCQMLIL